MTAMNAINSKKEKGFTLIELVMVIVILGILAAFALPRFADFGSEARVSSINGLAGAMKSAASIAHARQIASNAGPDDSVTLDGQSIDMIAGFPEASAAGIGQAAQISDDYDSTADSTAESGTKTFFIAPDTDGTGATACRVTYTAANDTSGSEAPFTVVTDTSDC